MNSLIKVILVVALLAGFIVWNRARHAAHPPQGTVGPVTPAVNTEPWTPERIVKDPQGYITWSDQQVKMQIDQRETRLKNLADQRADIDARRSQMMDNLNEIQNLRVRIQNAYTKADDEEHWPMVVAGRSFSRDAAKGVLDKTQKYIDDRKSLAQSYDEAVGRLDQLSATLHKDINDLNDLREKLALDLEKVKLNQGIAEMDQFRKTEGELESMSKTLAAIDQQSVTPLPVLSKGGSDRQDVADMLK